MSSQVGWGRRRRRRRMRRRRRRGLKKCQTNKFSE